VAQELIRGLSDPVPPLGVVIDLRGNRGGVLQQAVAAAAMLQASGVVAVTVGRDPEAAHIFLADGRDLAHLAPVVVLVDGGSASAAEILAASLADQRRAVVVGSSTLGKGLVQTILPLPDGGELLVSWSRVLAPLGWPIQALGVLPQVCTSLGPQALDRQLAALAHGQQPMAAALARHRAARAPLPPAEALELRAACPAAEGQDADLAAARFLIATPEAYSAALLPQAAGGAVPQNLTPKAPMRD
jgi:carboxyl-terminal processing protease